LQDVGATVDVAAPAERRLRSIHATGRRIAAWNALLPDYNIGPKSMRFNETALLDRRNSSIIQPQAALPKLGSDGIAKAGNDKPARRHGGLLYNGNHHARLVPLPDDRLAARGRYIAPSCQSSPTSAGT
jgi:hypothetical protein